METTIAAPAAKTSAPLHSPVEAQVLSQYFNAFPSNMSFDAILDHLGSLMTNCTVLVKSAYFGLQVDALRTLLRDTAWGFDVALALMIDGIDLPVILDLAESYVSDIESGLEDGTYTKDENPNIGRYRATVDEAGRWYIHSVAPTLATARADGVRNNAPQPAKSGSPSRVLSVVDSGGILEVYIEQGTTPGVECESVDGMNGEQGDSFTLTHEWLPLLTKAFGDKLPSYVKVIPADAAEQDNDDRFLSACDHVGSSIDKAVGILMPAVLDDQDAASRARCAGRIAVVANAYRLFTGVEGADNLVAVLADIRHFCDSQNLDFREIDQTSYLQYGQERHSAITALDSTFASVDEAGMVRAGVLATNAGGEVELYFGSVPCSEDDRLLGKHLEAIERHALDKGFEAPMIAFDAQDPVARQSVELAAFFNLKTPA